MHPRKSLYLSIVAVTLSFCAMPAVGAGTNLWTIMSQGSPSWLNNIWRTNSAGLGNSFTPVAGNTYVMTSNGFPMGGAPGSTANTRVRPPTTGTATFPGDSLTMLTQT